MTSMASKFSNFNINSQSKFSLKEESAKIYIGEQK